MVEPPCQPQGPTSFVSAAAAETSDSSAERAEWIYNRRIEARADASRFGWLNRLTKSGMRGCGHIDNPMYLQLLANLLSEEQMERFLGAYYWGSGYGFQKVVLPIALKREKNPLWRGYIKGIVHEENTPRSHCGIFKSFVESLGFDVGPTPKPADVFIEKMVDGYQGELGPAVGYALGIETEADYQISLISVPFSARYPVETAASDFFEIHMSETGEEQHARSTCEIIESLVETDICKPSDIEAGFVAAIVDTRDYMVSIYDHVNGHPAEFAGSGEVER